MFETVEMSAVPAFIAKGKDGRSVTFAVTLLFQDASGAIRITAAVERAIDETLAASRAEGLVTAKVMDTTPWEITHGHVERAMGIEGAMLLLQCQSDDGAERLMQRLASAYELSLVRR